MRAGGAAHYPEEYLDLGPRIKKVFPDEADFDASVGEVQARVLDPGLKAPGFKSSTYDDKNVFQT